MLNKRNMNIDACRWLFWFGCVDSVVCRTVNQSFCFYFMTFVSPLWTFAANWVSEASIHSRAIRSAATGNQWSGPLKSFQDKWNNFKTDILGPLSFQDKWNHFKTDFIGPLSFQDKWNHLKTDFIDPLRWFPVATDLIARLSEKVNRGLQYQESINRSLNLWPMLHPEVTICG